jgi:hypothetical protein
MPRPEVYGHRGAISARAKTVFGRLSDHLRVITDFTEPRL